jgi:hypothetical protein
LRRLAIGCAVISCAAITIAVIATVRSAAAAAGAVPARIDELTVGRLNVVEPDGTPRMIIASRVRFPGAPVRGKDIPRPDRRDLAGILFVDDEGTENGGLVQNGQLHGDKVEAGLSLTFDRFRQDQMLQLLLDENGDTANVGVLISDRPSYKQFSIEDLMRIDGELKALQPAERDAAIKRHTDAGHFGVERAFFGTRDGNTRLVLRDPKGRPRLVLSVSTQGEPSIALLDEAGKTVRMIDLHTP